MSGTRGNVVSARGSVNVRDEPDHLLVLVHGIMARYVATEKGFKPASPMVLHGIFCDAFMIMLTYSKLLF